MTEVKDKIVSLQHVLDEYARLNQDDYPEGLDTEAIMKCLPSEMSKKFRCGMPFNFENCTAAEMLSKVD